MYDYSVSTRFPVINSISDSASHVFCGSFVSNVQVEAKRALSREEQQTSRPASNVGRSSGGAGTGGNYRTKKIFVGGLPSTLTEDQFRQYFETYGDITDVVIMFDQTTNRPRGFGFISFDTEDAVDRVLQKTFHELNNKLVEVKRALPKDVILGSNFGYYDIQMDVNRFLQQTSGLGQEVVVKISKRQVVVTIWASDKQVTNSLYVIFKSVVGRWKCVAHVCNSCI